MKQENIQTFKVHTYEPETDIFPFAVLEVETEETHTFEAVLGNCKTSSLQFDTKEDCEDYILSKPYGLIIALISETITLKNKYDKEQVEPANKQENETKEEMLG